VKKPCEHVRVIFQSEIKAKKNILYEENKHFVIHVHQWQRNITKDFQT